MTRIGRALRIALLSRLRQTQPLAGINALADRLPPVSILQIPLHGAFQPAFESLPRPPAKLGVRLGGVDRIPVVVPRTVRHESHQRSPLSGLRDKPVDDVADCMDDLKVGAFAMA